MNAFLCGSLRNSAISALRGAIKRRDRRGPQSAEKSELFSHRQEFEFDTAHKFEIERSRRNKPTRRVKLNSRQRGHQLEPAKSLRASFIFTPRQNRARDSLARVFRMNEESPDLRKLPSRIKVSGRFRRILIASEESLSLTPSTATNQYS